MINNKNYLMPYSIEAEQAVLGGIILDNDTWETISNALEKNDFYKKKHQIIFNAMEYLIKKNEPLDTITLSEILKQEDNLEKIGGKSYLENLLKNTHSAKNILAYSNIIKNKSSLRKLITTSKNIIELALDYKNENISDLIDKAEEKILSISQKHRHENQDNLINISTILTGTIKKIETLFESNSYITGLSTGFKDLDKITSGLHPADLIIIAGRPSMGKTTLAINIAEHIIIKKNIPVLIFSMEMPAEQVTIRMLSSLGRIELQRLRTGMLKETDWPRLSSAISFISGKHLFIDDSGSLTPFDIKSRARNIYKTYKNLGIIIIDYLQLMHIPGLNDYRAAEISEISRSLKILAKELKVPIIALSQLNRSLEQRLDKRPIMSDLRESGAIEQDADLIIFIYRDEIYNKNSTNSGTAEIIIAKQRNGPIGTLKLTFFGHYSKFENFISEQ